jgi:hypothetical protein
MRNPFVGFLSAKSLAACPDNRRHLTGRPKKMKRKSYFIGFMLAASAFVVPGFSSSQPALSNPKVEVGPKVEKTYGKGLPRDASSLVFDDNQYPVWPLTPMQLPYARINGERMKQQVRDLSAISLRYRDAGNKWWGRFPGTNADREGMSYMTRAYEALVM